MHTTKILVLSFVAASFACGCQHQPARSASHRPSHAPSRPVHLHGMVRSKPRTHAAAPSSKNAKSSPATRSTVWGGELD